MMSVWSLMSIPQWNPFDTAFWTKGVMSVENMARITTAMSAADLDTLQDASMKRARVALIRVPDGHETYLIARHIRRHDKRCYIVTKVHTEHDHDHLRRERLADTILWPEKLSARIASDIIFERAM